MKESSWRSFLKAISWRFLATLITFTVALVLTGRTVVAIKIGVLDTVIKIFAYFLHERLWGQIKLGKKLHPLEDIKVNRELEDKDKEIIKSKLKDLGYLDE